MDKTKATKLRLPSHTESKGTGMANSSGLINKSIDPTLGGKNNKGNHKTNSLKPKKSPNLKKLIHQPEPLVNQSSLLTPKFGLLRIQKNRLSNMDAISDISPSSGIEGGGGGAPSTPAQTSIVEIMTQTMEALVTQNNDYIVTQKEP